MAVRILTSGWLRKSSKPVIWGVFIVVMVLGLMSRYHWILHQDSSVKCAVRTENKPVPETSTLVFDGYIRNCVTGSKIGRTAHVETVSIDAQPAGTYNSPETTEFRQQWFQQMFDKRVWVEKKEESSYFNGPVASGLGSTILDAQDTIMMLSTIVDQFKRIYQVSRVRLLDIPCGDFVWMSRFLMHRDDIEYTGVDIVPSLIKSHQKLFSHRKEWTFVLTDVVKGGQELFSANTSNFDLVLSRQMMQHLYDADIIKLLINLSSLASRSQSPMYLLTTSFNWSPGNTDVTKRGLDRFHPVNLEIPPFSLEPPLCIAKDSLVEYIHLLGMWRLPLRRIANCSTAVALQPIGFPTKFYSCVNWTLN